MQTSIFHREARPFLMVRLVCTKCGSLRMAIEPTDETITTLECPYCFGAAKAERIGSGQTLRRLPYFEAESTLEAAIRQQPNFGQSPPRLHRGQLVVYCEETTILHLAAVGDIHTSAAHLSARGIPAISFRIGERETDPVQHISAAPGCPPWWCLPEEVKGAIKMQTSARKRGPKEI